MHDNIDVIICSKCQNEIRNNENFRTFSCDHRICDNCYKSHLLERSTMILFPVKLLNCIILGCNGYQLNSARNFIDYIENTNDEKLIKKYMPSILFLQYGLEPFFQREYEKYIELYLNIIELIANSFDCCRKYKILYCILEIIGIIFAIVFFPIYIIILPIFFHFAIKDLYYFKFLPELNKRYNNNKLLAFSIILAEEILSIVFLFSLIALHYIYSILFFPIMLLVLLIRNLIYGVQMC